MSRIATILETVMKYYAVFHRGGFHVCRWLCTALLLALVMAWLTSAWWVPVTGVTPEQATTILTAIFGEAAIIYVGYIVFGVTPPGMNVELPPFNKVKYAVDCAPAVLVVAGLVLLAWPDNHVASGASNWMVWAAVFVALGNLGSQLIGLERINRARLRVVRKYRTTRPSVREQ